MGNSRPSSSNSPQNAKPKLESEGYKHGRKPNKDKISIFDVLENAWRKFKEKENEEYNRGPALPVPEGGVWTEIDGFQYFLLPYLTSEMRAKGNNRVNSTQLTTSLWVQEKGNRNKRKFLSDPPLGDPNKLGSCSQTEHPNYEFSAEGSQSTASPEQYCLCQMGCFNQDVPDAFQLEVKVSGSEKSSMVDSGQLREELGLEDFPDADWSDLTESQLQELCLNNLDMIFKSAIKKIAACGYAEDVAMKAVLRADLCYGCKDTVSNIVDNTITFLKSGQEIDAVKDHLFENLEQLEKYILAEMVCVLREIRPFFSTGDAMWCLLMSDMNVSHACAMEGDPLNGLGSNETSGSSSSVSASMQMKSNANSSEEKSLNVEKPNPLVSGPDNLQPETSAVKGIPNLPNPGKSVALEALEGLASDKESPISTSATMEKSLGAIQEFVQSKSQPSSSLEKLGGGRKGHVGKREYILRQKSYHLEKNYRGALKTGKLSSLGSLLLDKKPKGSGSAGITSKNASSKVRKAGVNITQADGKSNLSSNAGVSNSSTSNQKTVNTSTALSAANTGRSLSMPSKSSAASDRLMSTMEVPSYGFYGIPFDKAIEQWVPRDKRDEMIMKLVPRVEELQGQLQEWTEWTNHKVMQAARRLGKDKAELKTLRQEKEEAEHFQKERQALEENTMKKLSEMENALNKATAQVERANATVRRLEMENIKLKEDLQDAKIRAEESATNCQEVSKREKKMMKNFQSRENQKAALQEELATLRRQRVQLEQEVEQAKEYLNQLEARRKQEEKAKENLLRQAESIRKERERIEAEAEREEEMIKLKAENDLKKYKDDIRNLETQISQLRMKANPSKAAPLQWGSDGRNGTAIKGTNQTACISGTRAEFQDNPGGKNVKRERECVMCLTEERSVVFLPCSHQVVCTSCNELHEKHGMKECPSCRTPIQRRICARFARP